MPASMYKDPKKIKTKKIKKNKKIVKNTKKNYGKA
jgi:hypothetical protein